MRELQGWGIVRVVHVMGDRRDHFESMKDVWEMFRVVLDQRKRREIDPTLEMLRHGVVELEQDSEADSHTKQRLKEMLDFFESSLSLYEEFKRMPPKALRGVLRVKARTRKLVDALLGG